MEKKLYSTAEELGIRDLLEKYPYEVSGGQKQRAAVARAIVTDPRLIFADEPTGALDYETGKSVLKLLSQLGREKNTTVLIITHNQAIAPMADRVLRIKSGRIESCICNSNPVSIDNIEW